MFRETGQICGAELKASDGTIGRVDDVLFDAKGWRTRFFVVDAGGWLSGRQVLIAPSAVAGPFKPGCLPVNLTLEQVRRSPEVDPAQPLSREHEERLNEHYGWLPGWLAPGLPLAVMAAPIIGVAGPVSVPVVPPTEPAPQPAETDEHTPPFSAAAVRGSTVAASDGEIGKVEELVFDDADWGLRYLVIDTGSWMPGRHVVIAPQWVERIEDGTVHVALRRDSVKNSPAYDRKQTITPEFDARTKAHYLHGKA